MSDKEYGRNPRFVWNGLDVMEGGDKAIITIKDFTNIGKTYEASLGFLKEVIKVIEADKGVKHKESKVRDVKYYYCTICGRPNPRIAKEQGEEPHFIEFVGWTEKQVIKHIKKCHPEIAKRCK